MSKCSMPAQIATVVLDDEGNVLVGSIATTESTANQQGTNPNFTKLSVPFKEDDASDGFFKYKKQKEVLIRISRC